MLGALFTYVIIAGICYWGVVGAWKALKLAFEVAKWVVGGIIRVAGALTDYVMETIDNLDSNHQVVAVNIAKIDDPMIAYFNYMKDQGRVTVGDAIDVTKRLNQNRGASIVMSTVKDRNAKIGVDGSSIKISDATNKYEKQIQDALESGRIFESPIR